MSYHPTKEDTEELNQTVRELESILYQVFGEKLELYQVGSTAKGTWLRHEADIDYYLVFQRINITEEQVWKILQSLFPEGRIKEGQLKIWSLTYNGFDVDLVLPKEGKREDTILHTDYYNSHLTDAMRAEIRTAKAWFKNFGVYGAEVGGIIGVAIEQLVILKKDFLGVCKLLAGPRPYVQDPTLLTPRDLLASIIPKRWKVIQGSCRYYMEHPRVRVFDHKSMTVQEFRETYSRIYSDLRFERLRDKALDFQTALSVASRLARYLENLEEEVEVEYDVFVDRKEIIVVYNAQPRKLGYNKVRKVDPAKAGTAGVNAFKSAHPGAYEKDGMVYARVKRSYTRPHLEYKRLIKKEMGGRGYVLRTN